MSTRREHYVSLAEKLGVPQEIEAVSIQALIERSPQRNLYEVVVAMSRRAEQILTELTQELRDKLTELNKYEEVALRDPKQIEMLREETQNWVRLYRSLPKPSLIALWEKLEEPPVPPATP
ncbi:MAG: hypothetical protein ABDH91_04025 [Bacteroidia bacterium]